MKEVVDKIQPLSKLMRNTVSLILGRNRVKHRLRVPDDLWPAGIDDRYVFQIISCLVTNAVDSLYDNKGFEFVAENIVMETGEHPLLEKGGYIRIIIKDDGMGIPEDNLDKIFEPYFTTKPGGVGLGLSVVRAILDKNHGYISVESEISAGSKFTLYLPALLREGNVNSRCQHLYGISPTRGRILVVDGEEMIRNFAGNTIAKLGYEVELTDCSLEATRLYRQAKIRGRSFDALILDLALPGDLNGKNALTRLESIDPNIKVIASSSYYNDPTIVNFEELGFDGALVKPYNLREISHLLSQVMN